VISQDPKETPVAGSARLLPLWPMWLTLVVFETALWLLLALRFRQPCAVIALAVGLTFGTAVAFTGNRGPRAALAALLLTALTIALVLYAQASLHIARVLHLPPLQALIDTGPAFAHAVLDGLLGSGDRWLLVAGLVLAIATGFGAKAPPWRNRGRAHRRQA
jgi:hypothetical protein